MAVDLQKSCPWNVLEQGVSEQLGATACPPALLDVQKASILHTSFENNFGPLSELFFAMFQI